MPTTPTIRVDIDPDHKPRVTDLDTGEVLDITDLTDADADVKAAVYGQLVQIASNVSTLRTQMKDQIETAFHEGEIETASFYGGVKLTRSAVRKWDPKRVGVVLDRLAEEGVVKRARADAAAPVVEVIKPDGKKLNVLLQELAGTDAGADLASTKTDAVNWKAEVVDVADVPPVDEDGAPQNDPPPSDPVDAFFASEAA
jgi:hypothetical protein